MILEQGEKVHIVERRYFADDLRCHLVGEVTTCTEQAIRLEAYLWVYDIANGRFVRKPEKRERIVCLGDRVTINVLPTEADLDAVRYATDPERGLVATDGRSFTLEVTEFTVMR